MDNGGLAQMSKIWWEIKRDGRRAKDLKESTEAVL